MGLEHIKSLPDDARVRLRRSLCFVGFGLYLAWLAIYLNLMACMISEEWGGYLPWLAVVVCGLVNATTGLAAAGTVATFRAINRSWPHTLIAVALLLSSAAALVWAECRLERFSHLSQAAGIWLLPTGLQALCAEVYLRGMRPFIPWDLDVKLLQSVRQILESTPGASIAFAKSAWRRARTIRRPSTETVRAILNELRVPLLLWAIFDACLLAGFCSIHLLIGPILFDVIPKGQFLVIVTLRPLYLVGFELLSGVVIAIPMALGLAALGGFLVILSGPIGGAVNGTIRLRCDLA